jgi:UDP-N-acetylglucosamine 2-epimerase (non-hydrolysing)
MEADQQPTDVLSRILLKLPAVLTSIAPDVVLVQGDTSTTLAAALCAYHAKLPVGHVEAGLRTDDAYSPFPEEMNRRLATRLAAVHFAPTGVARDRLLGEGIAPDEIVVTGNTVVDAVHQLAARAAIPHGVTLRPSARSILLTSHRRENHGAPLEDICLAVRDIVEREPDVDVVWPLHPNPNVGARVRQMMRGVPHVHLIEPVSYLELLGLLQASTIVLTDSGGLQEEAPAFGRPVLVLRESTERPEGVDAGVARVIGTARETVRREVQRLLRDADAYRAMSSAPNPYGDGQASNRILDALLRRVPARRADARDAAASVLR